MYLIGQVMIYLALALIIGSAIGYALRSCMADTACDVVRDELSFANARYEALMESQSAAEKRQVVTGTSPLKPVSGFANMDARTFEHALLDAAPGTSLKLRFGADDLTIIRGIVPKTDAWLGLHGITRLSQIASLNAAELYWIVEHALENGESVYRDNWVAQAQRLAAQDS